MTWNNPATRTTGDLINASIWNTDLVDNLLALKNPPSAVAEVATNYTSSSNIFVDVDSTNLKLTITTTGGIVLAYFGAELAVGSSGFSQITVAMDTVNVAGTNGIGSFSSSIGSETQNFLYYIDGVSAGSHDFALQWRNTDSQSMTLRGAIRYPIQFWVREIS